MDGRPVVFGEVLFDRFPDGASVLGGAPFNVAWHLQGFGAAPLFISRVGDDAPGRRVGEAMRDWGMDTAGLQVDRERRTGAVRVSLDQGQPSFDILPEQAYDYIDVEGATRTLEGREPALVYHGTLIMRLERSRQALDAVCGQLDCPVFVDVNLRDPWWREADLPFVLRRATWVKVNEDELARIASRLGQRAESLEETAREFLRLHELALLIVTRGGDGAVAFELPDRVHVVRPRSEISIVDTVGAGDAFAAVLVLGLLRDWPLPATLGRAQRFASRVCGLRGATTADPDLYREVMRAWSKP